MNQNNNKAVFEEFDAKGYRVGLVAAQFNRSICDSMLDEALSLLSKYGVEEKDTTVHKVAGSVEIPTVLQKMAQSDKFDALVAIGVIIRGDTAHFDYVANIVSDGILRVQLDNTIPIGFGVLTLENEDQAENRLHVGKEAAEAALQSAKILKQYE